MVDLMANDLHDTDYEELGVINNEILIYNGEECDSFESLLSASILEPTVLTQIVRCSAHTLQLCIIDGLKCMAVQNIIEKSRKVILVYLLF